MRERFLRTSLILQLWKLYFLAARVRVSLNGILTLLTIFCRGLLPRQTALKLGETSPGHLNVLHVICVTLAWSGRHLEAIEHLALDFGGLGPISWELKNLVQSYLF